jgi:hypothetical protein
MKLVDFVMCNVENIHMLIYIKYVATHMQFMRQYTYNIWVDTCDIHEIHIKNYMSIICNNIHSMHKRIIYLVYGVLCVLYMMYYTWILLYMWKYIQYSM